MKLNWQLVCKMPVAFCSLQNIGIVEVWKSNVSACFEGTVFCHMCSPSDNNHALYQGILKGEVSLWCSVYSSKPLSSTANSPLPLWSTAHSIDSARCQLIDRHFHRHVMPKCRSVWYRSNGTLLYCWSVDTVDQFGCRRKCHRCRQCTITEPLTSCLTGLESAVWQLTIFVFICKTD